MSARDQRLKILEMVSHGIITPAQAAALLNVLQDADGSPEEEEWEAAAEESDSSPGAASEAEAGFAGNSPFGYAQFAGAEPLPSPLGEPHPQPEAPHVEPELEPEAGTEEHPMPTQNSGYAHKKPLPNPAPTFARWRRWWLIPLACGIALTLLSGLLLYAATRAAWNPFWIACLWLPTLAGTAIILLAWANRNTRWLHVRVDRQTEEWPRRIAISLPLPLRTTAFFFKYFGRYIPQLDTTGLDEVILALHKSATPDSPIYIEVEEGEDGEKVQVYIG